MAIRKITIRLFITKKPSATAECTGFSSLTGKRLESAKLSVGQEIVFIKTF